MKKNIITRLEDAATMLREYEQYNDDPDCNGEGLAADACDDAGKIILSLLDLLTLALPYVQEGEEFNHPCKSKLSKRILEAIASVEE